jgi:ADP-L-glycero-D-manno-heptose 6-epimerase
MTYLVTGAAGFIGSRFVESCNARGIDVVSVDAPEHFSSRGHLEGLNLGTIVPRDDLFSWLKRKAPKLDAVIHIGARTDTAEKDERVFEKLNIRYTQDLWKYATERELPFIYASSAATYGDGSQGFDDREDLLPSLKPLNPYGRSKHVFDLWALEQEKKGNHPPSWSGWKFFNVYGFGESHKAFMASVVLHSYDQARTAGAIKLFRSHRPDIRDGYQARDFVFVDDLIEVLHYAAEKPIQRGVFNLGTGQARPYIDLARAVFKAMGKPENIVFVDTPESIRASYQYFTEAVMSRLRLEGYLKPFTSLEEGVRKYVLRLQAGR